MIHAYLCVTDTHEPLLSILKETLPLDLDLHVLPVHQKCVSGRFKTQGWKDTMFDKVGMIVAACESHPEGSILLHLDADIQFFASRLSPLILSHLRGLDFCGQNNAAAGNKNEMCGGFFAFRNSTATRKLFCDIIDGMRRGNNHDQLELNRLLPLSGLRYGYFARHLVWCPGRRWKPGLPLKLPPEVLVHHANWTIGVENKIAQLKEGRRLFAKLVGGAKQPRPADPTKAQ
jgi:hypothetical protein